MINFQQKGYKNMFITKVLSFIVTFGQPGIDVVKKISSGDGFYTSVSCNRNVFGRTFHLNLRGDFLPHEQAPEKDSNLVHSKENLLMGAQISKGWIFIEESSNKKQPHSNKNTLSKSEIL
jgi:hypothetical protein